MNNNYNGFNGDYGNSGYPQQPVQPQYDQPAPQPYQQPAPQPYQQPVPQSAPYNSVPQSAPVDPGKNTGIASVVLGTASLFIGIIFGWLVIFFIPVNLVSLGCSIAGLITGIKSKKASLAAGLDPSGTAKAGFICSMIGLVISIILTILGCGIILAVVLALMSGS